MKKIYNLALAAVVLLCVTACRNGGTATSFVQTDGTHFVLDGQPYYYIGTNMWYGAVLASEGRGGDRDRLARELDALDQMGVRNLRILVGAEGEERARKVLPVLQTEPGVYNDTILAGLDWLLVEMGKRDMKAVLYLNNSWSWSGGYSTYLKWAGFNDEEVLDSIAWTDWLAYGANYARCREAQQLFFQHVDFIVSRTNRYTGLPYSQDPTIMAWQVGNEPRAFDPSPEVKEAFAEWVLETCHRIKSIDPNHLVSIGSEGLEGSERDADLYMRIHADSCVDYLTLHIWPQNWQWVKRGTVAEGTDVALIEEQLRPVKKNTKHYIRQHDVMAQRLQKPMVIEEFGYPRDANAYDPTSTTVAKDQYYGFMFDQVAASARGGGALAGCNFWGWNGEARMVHLWWQPYDPYMADPAQEEQGLYGVFDSDSTCGVIEEAVRRVDESLRANAKDEDNDEDDDEEEDDDDLEEIEGGFEGF